MACTIDHLSADHRIRVIRRFRDARGIEHEAGETGVIRRIELDWPANEIVIEWEHGPMRFRLDAREGPRNGGMKEYFKVLEYAPPPRPRPPPPAPPAPQPVLDDSPQEDWDAAAALVWALAARGRFDEARTQVLRIQSWPHRMGGDEKARWLSEHLGRAAAAHAFDADGAVYDWLKEWCIGLLYQWGSGATSGGEGTARRREMDVVEKSFEELERKRLSPGARGPVS
jgi:hypothetical protein